MIILLVRNSTASWYPVVFALRYHYLHILYIITGKNERGKDKESYTNKNINKQWKIWLIVIVLIYKADYKVIFIYNNFFLNFSFYIVFAFSQYLQWTVSLGDRWLEIYSWDIWTLDDPACTSLLNYFFLLYKCMWVKWEGRSRIL